MDEDGIAIWWLREVWHRPDTSPAVRASIIKWIGGRLEERRS